MGRKKSDASSNDVRARMEEPFAQRLTSLIAEHNNAKDLQNELGISPQAISQYKNGDTRPSLENICKIADFYHVSVDYLLGRTDAKSTDYNIQAVHEYTGLSELAIQKLKELNEYNNVNSYLDVLSLFVEDDGFREIISTLCLIISCKIDCPEQVVKIGHFGDISRLSMALSMLSVITTTRLDIITGNYKKKYTLSPEDRIESAKSSFVQELKESGTDISESDIGKIESILRGY
ncbi:MAG: helix-turn-helix domain-containing protein [Faecousia sp.]